MKLDVYGRKIEVLKEEKGWQVYTLGVGHKNPANIIIPEELETEEQVITYLEDLYHEAATPERPNIVRLNQDQNVQSGNEKIIEKLKNGFRVFYLLFVANIFFFGGLGHYFVFGTLSKSNRFSFLYVVIVYIVPIALTIYAYMVSKGPAGRIISMLFLIALLACSTYLF